MKLINEIARTIYAIRRAGDVDVERLCFEVSPGEWLELIRYFQQTAQFPIELPAGNCINVMGITVRVRQP